MTNDLRLTTNDAEQSKETRSGAVSLAAMIIVGSIILEIGIAGAVLVFFLTSGGLGARLSQEAYIAAQAGVEDTLIKLVRDKNLCLPASTCSYEGLLVGNASVDVTFTRDTGNPPQHRIQALGRAVNKSRKLCVKAEVHSITGQVTVVQVIEQEIPVACP